MSNQRLLWPDADPEELDAGWTPLTAIPKDEKITAGIVLSVLAKRHDESGWNGRPGRWIFLPEVPAFTGAWGEQQRFDAVALGLVPSVRYARIVYEIKVSRSDWLRELRPKIVARYNGNRISQHVVAHDLARPPSEQRLKAAGIEIEEHAKWEAAMSVATEFWYVAPVRCILPNELPDGAGLLEIRPWGKAGEHRGRVAVKAQILDTPNPGPEFWASILRHLAGRAR